jgi:hypothetical protein
MAIPPGLIGQNFDWDTYAIRVFTVKKIDGHYVVEPLKGKDKIYLYADPKDCMSSYITNKDGLCNLHIKCNDNNSRILLESVEGGVNCFFQTDYENVVVLKKTTDTSKVRLIGFIQNGTAADIPKIQKNTELMTQITQWGSQFGEVVWRLRYVHNELDSLRKQFPSAENPIEAARKMALNEKIIEDFEKEIEEIDDRFSQFGKLNARNTLDENLRNAFIDPVRALCKENKLDEAWDLMIKTLSDPAFQKLPEKKRKKFLEMATTLGQLLDKDLNKLKTAAIISGVAGASKYAIKQIRKAAKSNRKRLRKQNTKIKKAGTKPGSGDKPSTNVQKHINEKEAKELYADALEKGESIGYDKGYKAGYDKGYKEGQKDGIEKGFKDGYTSGFEDGKKEFYKKGEDDGYEKGFKAAKKEFMTEAEKAEYDRGYADALRFAERAKKDEEIAQIKKESDEKQKELQEQISALQSEKDTLRASLARLEGRIKTDSLLVSSENPQIEDLFPIEINIPTDPLSRKSGIKNLPLTPPIPTISLDLNTIQANLGKSSFSPDINFQSITSGFSSRIQNAVDDYSISQFNLPKIGVGYLIGSTHMQVMSSASFYTLRDSISSTISKLNTLELAYNHSHIFNLNKSLFKGNVELGIVANGQFSLHLPFSGTEFIQKLKNTGNQAFRSIKSTDAFALAFGGDLQASYKNLYFRIGPDYTLHLSQKSALNTLVNAKGGSIALRTSFTIIPGRFKKDKKDTVPTE